MYLYQSPGLGYFGDTQQAPALKNIRFIEVKNFEVVTGGLDPAIRFQGDGAMSNDKRQKFVDKFLKPMFKYKVALRLLDAIDKIPQLVDIAWGRGKFRGNGTVARNVKEARGGSGSGAVIFIDEDARDLDNFPLMRANPDILLFHELLHACDIQRGKDLAKVKPREYRIIGLGSHSDDPMTENAYRDARSMKRRCCLDREEQS